ncbi:MAG: hypothetical protein VR64_15840 [Desulfatitalea sp. BRH_c12]|nr:MAG: hypothetical protein VR64_15840 [Desulfatitalea sp. BRH_c12]
MKTKPIILTLKAKLVILFLILALLPSVIIGAFSIRITEKVIVTLVLQQLENVAADKAAILERWLEERKADLQVIAGTSIVQTMTPEDIGPYLTLVQDHYGVYRDISVMDANGGVVFSSRGQKPDVDNATWDDFSAGRALQISDITYSPNDKESTFNIAVPISQNQEIKGTVYGTVGTSSILYSILTVSLGRTGECYLVDKNGTFLAHKEPNRILRENISQSESFKNIFNQRDRHGTYLDYRGIEVFTTSRKVGGTEWYLVVEQDRDEAFESAQSLKRYVYLTVLLCIVSAFLITWVVSYHVVRPIRELSRSANILAQSQFTTTEVKTRRQDEIGILYNAFENMALRVRERQNTLEKTVYQKDAALKETDLTLKQIRLIAERSEKFAAIGRLGAAVAHEIRTPLTSLKLFLESVQSDIEISPEYVEDFDIAMRQIRRIESAINRFLEYTKPQELAFAQISVADLIAGVVFMIRPMANKQECVLDIAVENGLPPIRGDKRFLEESLVNLFINSLEAMPFNGKLSVTATQDRLQENGHASACVRIDVRDSGPGISEAHIDLIFDPFFTTKSAGTGLGLPLVINTIQRHGGRVHVANHATGGAIFSLFIPCGAPE